VGKLPIVPCESLSVFEQKIPRFRQGNAVCWQGQETTEEPRVRVDAEAVEDSTARYGDYAEFVIDYKGNGVTLTQLSSALKLRNLASTGSNSYCNSQLLRIILTRQRPRIFLSGKNKKEVADRLNDSDTEELFTRFRPLLREKQQGMDWLIHQARALPDEIIVEVLK
jgi:hypothetical protein